MTPRCFCIAKATTFTSYDILHRVALGVVVVQFDVPERSAWTLPYIVTVNDDHPFGMYVSYPEAFDGAREDDDRLKWYAVATTKDIIFSAEVYT